MRKTLERGIGHVVFGSRRWIEKQLRAVAAELPPGRILEIGSGRHDLGTDAYSMRHLFAEKHDVVLSDVNPEFGHMVVDITDMDFDREFDAILCVSVLEHVPRFWKAIDGLYRALRPNGVLVVSVPMAFPYHDEPDDFWRFTKYGVTNLLSRFDDVRIHHRGLPRMPFTIMAVARRTRDEGDG